MLLALGLGGGKAWAETVTDVINNSTTSSYLSGTGTTTWASNFNITCISGAQYYVKSMGTKNTSNALQWNTNGFLYATASGGTLKSITVNGTSGKSVKVYAQNSAYSANASGNPLATISLTGSDVTYNFNSNYTFICIDGGASGTSITSLSIEWTKDSTPTTYTVTYDANEGTGTMTDSNSPYASGATVTVLANSFTRSGYTFSGWNTRADGEGTAYAAGATFSISSNTTLYAQWTSNAVATTTTINHSGITNTDVYTGTAAGSLTASVTAGGNAVQGATVTWSGNNDAVATIASDGTVTLVGAGTVTFTASYAGVTGEYQASSATYQMTVTSSAPYVQPTEVEINLNNSLFGTTYSGSASGITDANPISGGQDNVSVTYAGSGNHYVNDSQIRFYPNNKLTFEAPSGYVITSIVFTSAETWAATISADGGTYTSGTKTWTGSASSVIFTGSGSSRCDMSKATITLGLPSNDPVINASDVSIGYATTSGTIDYTIDNPVQGVSLRASSDADWISDITVGQSSVTFTATENEGAIDRVATITLSYEGAVNKVVTVTQNHPARDYTTLPFNWLGGTASELLAIDGVTLNNISLNDDYAASHAPYRVKFDNTGDYIQIKTDSQPGEITIGVKMIGGSSSSSITVQESADGLNNNYTNVQVLSIEGSQNAILSLTTTNPFQSSTRYVRIVFTKGNGSNVGVGPISIAQASNDAPMIDVTPRETVEVSATPEPGSPVIEGTLNITYQNITINNMGDFAVQFCDAVGNNLQSGSEPNWIEVLVAEQDPQVGEGYVVSYEVDEYTATSPRTAYFKIYAIGGNDYVYSNLITVQQAGIDYAILPFSFDGGKSAIETTLGLTHGNTSNEQGGLGSDYSSSPKLKFDDTGDYVILKLNETPKTLSFDIKGNSFEGSTFKVQTSANGETYTDLASYNALSSTETKTFTFAANPTVRYIKWIYTEKVNGNVALGNIKVNYEEVSVSEVSYGTYASNYALDFTNSSIKAYYATLDESTLTFHQINRVPANTGVLLYKDGGATEYVPMLTESAEAVTGNVFVRGNGTALTYASNNQVYVLQKVENVVGFYKANNNRVAANRSYVLVPTGVSGVKAFTFDFNDLTTEINELDNSTIYNSTIYNLNGQRVSKAKKGLYIINGKKVLVK